MGVHVHVCMGMYVCVRWLGVNLRSSLRLRWLALCQQRTPPQGLSTALEPARTTRDRRTHRPVYFRRAQPLRRVGEFKSLPQQKKCVCTHTSTPTVRYWLTPYNNEWHFFRFGQNSLWSH
jgi:hypothetical protein